ncbi:hypothetical protein WG922_13500 [Ramlibacter sp. AN1015]|uniref:hypothetical protein n=1 Tax=Ramlibacter sp. AN1015 TaxID=3133428 RepID=UPI0030BB1DB3
MAAQLRRRPTSSSSSSSPSSSSSSSSSSGSSVADALRDREAAELLLRLSGRVPAQPRRADAMPGVVARDDEPHGESMAAVDSEPLSPSMPPLVPAPDSILTAESDAPGAAAASLPSLLDRVKGACDAASLAACTNDARRHEALQARAEVFLEWATSLTPGERQAAFQRVRTSCSPESHAQPHARERQELRYQQMFALLRRMSPAEKRAELHHTKARLQERARLPKVSAFLQRSTPAVIQTFLQNTGALHRATVLEAGFAMHDLLALYMSMDRQMLLEELALTKDTADLMGLGNTQLLASLKMRLAQTRALSHAMPVDDVRRELARARQIGGLATLEAAQVKPSLALRSVLFCGFHGRLQPAERFAELSSALTVPPGFETAHGRVRSLMVSLRRLEFAEAARLMSPVELQTCATALRAPAAAAAESPGARELRTALLRCVLTRLRQHEQRSTPPAAQNHNATALHLGSSGSLPTGPR